MSRYKTKRTGGKRVSLHRWLMEQHHGRALAITAALGSLRAAIE